MRHHWRKRTEMISVMYLDLTGRNTHHRVLRSTTTTVRTYLYLDVTINPNPDWYKSMTMVWKDSKDIIGVKGETSCRTWDFTRLHTTHVRINFVTALCIPLKWYLWRSNKVVFRIPPWSEALSLTSWSMTNHLKSIVARPYPDYFADGGTALIVRHIDNLSKGHGPSLINEWHPTPHNLPVKASRVRLRLVFPNFHVIK